MIHGNSSLQSSSYYHYHHPSLYHHKHKFTSLSEAACFFIADVLLINDLISISAAFNFSIKKLRIDSVF